MKKTTILWIIVIMLCGLSTYDRLTFERHVKVSMVEIYDNFLDSQDSVMKSKQLLITRATLNELIADSTSVRGRFPDMQLFIVKPFLQPDSTIKGFLHEIQWKQTIPFFETLR